MGWFFTAGIVGLQDRRNRQRLDERRQAAVDVAVVAGAVLTLEDAAGAFTAEPILAVRAGLVHVAAGTRGLRAQVGLTGVDAGQRRIVALTLYRQRAIAGGCATGLDRADGGEVDQQRRRAAAFPDHTGVVLLIRVLPLALAS